MAEENEINKKTGFWKVKENGAIVEERVFNTLAGTVDLLSGRKMDLKQVDQNKDLGNN